MHIVLPEEVLCILQTLWADGHDAYAVGGCVRDRLMGTEPKDWDIATSALPPRVKALFPRTADTGIAHGTVTVVMPSMCCEVTTYRLDGTYLDGRRPSSVTFTACIEDDLSRRDFTMNAIAYNPRDGFKDPFDGRGDITRGVIRCVGCAAHRFGEDALRMLRAVRFAAQLGFAVTSETLSAIQPLAERLALVSAERIREELTKLLTGAHPRALPLLATTGLLPYVLREVYKGDLAAVARWLEHCPKEPAMVYALFLSWASNACGDILRDLRFDNRTRRETAAYVQWLTRPLPVTRYAVKRALNELPPPCFDRLLTLRAICTAPLEAAVCETVRAEVAAVVASGECYTLRTLAVNGRDLMTIGIPHGKQTGEILAKLLDVVMRDPSLNERKTLLRCAEQYAAQV